MAPVQKPGRSKQDYGTPDDFLEAVKRRLQINHFLVDLAATRENTVTPLGFLTEANNALEMDWPNTGWLWCNPPYSHIEPWVKKAALESHDAGARIAMLIPASVGANWWKEWVHNKAHVLLLNGRITFKGMTTPYPKDCALLLYTPFCHGGYEVWSWRNV